jgi:hypothetical protein
MKLRLFAFVVACLPLIGLVATLSGDSGPAGIVSELQGSAIVKEPRKQQRTLQVYDWIADGASITAGRGSRVVIVLASGARFALKEGARGALVGGTLSVSGNVEALPNFPPLPVIAPLASTVGPPKPAATRVRGRSFSNLYPAGHATLADSTTLRFEGPAGASKYLVTVHDQGGAPVLQQEIEDGIVVVPPHLLAPGHSYQWRVTVSGDSATPTSASGAFATLGAATASARSALRSRLSIDDAEDLVLLARVDEQLGLLYEARETLTVAAAKTPDDKVVRDMLTRLEQQLR